MALRNELSRIDSLAMRASFFCDIRPGTTINTTARMGIATKGPAINQKITKNSKKNGKSANAVAVLEVIRSRTCSSSLICEINEPVDLGRTLLRKRMAWPNTKSDTRRSARLPSMSVMRTRVRRIIKSNTSASTTPPNSTYKVGIDSAGITRSYTCIENSTPASPSTLVTSDANIT